MTPYTAIKRCLIDAWPNSTSINCASMVAIDFGVYEGDGRSGRKLLDSVKMNPQSLAVTHYLAAFYPKTSDALYNGASKDEAYRILLSEKKIKADHSKAFVLRPEVRKSDIDAARTIFIRARSLDKKHDWHTVK